MTGYFVADTAALAAVDTSANPKLRWVDTLKSKFFFVAGSTASNVANNIIAATDGGGKWFREAYVLLDEGTGTPPTLPLFIGQQAHVFVVSSGSSPYDYDGFWISTGLGSNDWSGPFK